MKFALLHLAMLSSVLSLSCGCCNESCEALGRFASMKVIPSVCTRKNAIGCLATGELQFCHKNGSGGCVLVSTDGSAFAPELNHSYPSDGRSGSTFLPDIDEVTSSAITTILPKNGPMTTVSSTSTSPGEMSLRVTTAIPTSPVSETAQTHSDSPRRTNNLINIAMIAITTYLL